MTRPHAGVANARMPISTEPELFEKVIDMKSKLLMSVAVASVIALTTLSGCSTSPTNAQIGTAGGAVLGGAAGNAIFGGTLGTLGGAAAGAVIGNEVGKKY
ncbi:MAG: 17 kDa surface antigen [Polaromonas sp.]|nr:17 kDa surface antigen [Polaromonas sp.]